MGGYVSTPSEPAVVEDLTTAKGPERPSASDEDTSGASVISPDVSAEGRRKAAAELAIEQAFSQMSANYVERSKGEKKVTEKKELKVKKTPWKEVTLSSTQTDVWLSPDAKRYQVIHRRLSSTKTDPWRVQGALEVIHKIGGIQYKANCAPKTIVAGSAPPLPPTTKPFVSIDDYLPFPALNQPEKKKSGSSSSSEKSC